MKYIKKFLRALVHVMSTDVLWPSHHHPELWFEDYSPSDHEAKR